MKALILISAPLLGSLLYFFVFEPFINQDRYEGIVVKSYNRDGTIYCEDIYVLDKQTGLRKRDWDR